MSTSVRLLFAFAVLVLATGYVALRAGNAELAAPAAQVAP